MKDCKGVNVQIGDNVVCIAGKNTDARLVTGEITKFYNCNNRQECSVGRQSHLISSRIMKL